MFAEIKATLHDFGVDFDVYFHENDLHESRCRRARRRTAARARPRSSSRTAPSGCGRPTSATTRTGCIIRSNGEPAYISRRPRLLPRQARPRLRPVVIMLGADHHGYVGRLMAMCAALRRRPGREPRGPHRAAGQPRQGRSAAADEQAGRHRRHARGPRRGGRRRRRPLRPGPLLDRLDARHRPRPADAAHQRQPGLLRAVRRARGPRPSIATPPTSASSAAPPRRSDPSCSSTSGRATCSASWGSSRASSRPPPSCASRTGSRATSRSSPAPTTGSTTPAGSCRAATRRSPTSPAPGSGSTTPPGRSSTTA